jgi:hypothetical protein
MNSSGAEGSTTKNAGLPEYVEYLDRYKGLTLREVGITCDLSGPSSKYNLTTWFFKLNDPGAFLLYDPDGTKITDGFLHRASTISYKINAFNAVHGYPIRK